MLETSKLYAMRFAIFILRYLNSFLRWVDVARRELDKFLRSIAIKYSRLSHENVCWQIKNQDLKETYAYAISEVVGKTYFLVSDLFLALTAQGKVYNDYEEVRKGKL